MFNNSQHATLTSIGLHAIGTRTGNTYARNGKYWSERTWLEQYTIDVWNVFGLDNELVASTNNPLEHFNRELNSRFPTPHSSMATFVTIINTIADEYVWRIGDVPRARARRVPRERIQLPEPVNIPTDIDIDVDVATALALRASDSTPVST
ncbi:hypothetical protein F441_13076 [Phytophthora nicotianae CJ01A1]|uniref:Uncharacterized protein n=1 Tax=Phytophthora nicotianae CJ01A1 TaxID=1317063 RepID=W2WLN4_PHYNI|nr:hypothetical protein F441_13076 [Phytophthora nicotianae CJ01A1]